MNKIKSIIFFNTEGDFMNDFENKYNGFDNESDGTYLNSVESENSEEANAVNDDNFSYEVYNSVQPESEPVIKESDSENVSGTVEASSDNSYSNHYLYEEQSPYEYRTSGEDESKPVTAETRNGFYTTYSRPVKKKKYMPVSAAVVAIVVSVIISIVGGAALSTYTTSVLLTDKKQTPNMPATSVTDNIKNAENTKGGTPTTHNALLGEALTTPEIVDKVGPAVVGIINKTTYGNAYGFYGSLYGNIDDEIEQGSGSGVVISTDGYIVTNNHVVENATALSVILNTGEEYTAKLVGKDASSDLAVVKIEATNLVYAQMGSSSDLRVGEKAIAIGNPLGQEFAGTTTEGIISGLNRSVTIENKTMTLIQTDAAINPGNSGGALVNEKGQLIGINTVKISSSTLEGLGFAIPIDVAKPIIQELMTNGYVTGRPVIGIAGRAVTKEDAEAYNLVVGVYVSSMTPNGPAYMAGMKIGDIVVECEGEPIETVDDINEIKNKKKPGDQIAMKVFRKGNYVDVAVILGEEVPGE